MSDLPEDDAPTTQSAMQRALAMKMAQIDAKPTPPRGGRFQRERAAAALSSSKSKPWMKA